MIALGIAVLFVALLLDRMGLRTRTDHKGGETVRRLFAVILCLATAFPLAGQKLDSPASQQYQELLTANDLFVTQGVYACFYDGEKQSNIFSVISASLPNKQFMMASFRTFKDGVMDDGVELFEGKPQTPSSAQGVYAELLTSRRDKDVKDHNNDLFRWFDGDITILRGRGELMPGQMRASSEFKMQHSTGRFIEDILLNTSTIHVTGKCVRIPNSKTPEEQYDNAPGAK